MNDLFGATPPRPKPARVIRDTRPSAAEEKARLCLELGRLAQRPPARVMAGTVDLTREWLFHQERAMRLCQNARASVPELTAYIATMRGYLK